MNEDKDNRHQDRARWRSRRGMLELDILLVAFARERYPHLTIADQCAYQQLLRRDDWEIWDWLQGRSAPPPALFGIVRLVDAHGKRDSR